MATATPLEWALGGVIGFGLALMLWLLADGALDLRWVYRQRHARPQYDWSSAHIQGWGHLWTLLGLTAVQAIFAAISLGLIATAPQAAPGCLCPPPPTTWVGLLVRWGLIGAEALLIVVAFNLRVVRHWLLDNVARIGGD